MNPPGQPPDVKIAHPPADDPLEMKLVACPSCHAQYDADQSAADSIVCRCGTTFTAKAPASRDVAVTRCGSCGALLSGAETTCSYCRAEVVRTPTPAGPVCPECYARNPEGARHCTACGIAFLPQPIRSRPEPLSCPVCPSTRLGSRSIGGLWTDECPHCLGLWAPGDVMDRLVSRVEEAHRQQKSAVAGASRRERHAAWQSQVVYRHCPECGGSMQRKNFGGRSGVVLDWCGSHGTWLDAHEMEDVAAFVMAGGLDHAPDASMPADPARTAAVLAAEQLLIEERARSEAKRRVVTARGWRGLGDLFDQIMK